MVLIEIFLDSELGTALVADKRKARRMRIPPVSHSSLEALLWDLLGRAFEIIVRIEIRILQRSLGFLRERVRLLHFLLGT